MCSFVWILKRNICIYAPFSWRQQEEHVSTRQPNNAQDGNNTRALTNKTLRLLATCNVKVKICNLPASSIFLKKIHRLQRSPQRQRHREREPERYAALNRRGLGLRERPKLFWAHPFKFSLI